MIQRIRISTIEELLPLLSDQEFNPELKRNRNSYVYRGMPDAAYNMETSIHRNCKDLQWKLEPAILKNFAKYAILEDAEIGQSVWRQMILGQHHGLPTRLIDWTHSVLIGLHFAVSTDDMTKIGKQDGVLWRIDMEELHTLIPEKYKAVLRKNNADIFSINMMNEITNSLEQYDRDMGESAMVVVEPSSIDARIVNQYSFFTIVPSGIENIEEFLDKNTNNTVQYIIDKDLCWRIVDMLDQLNISERIIYPGLDGLSKWIARHYFVKEDTFS